MVIRRACHFPNMSRVRAVNNVFVCDGQKVGVAVMHAGMPVCPVVSVVRSLVVPKVRNILYSGENTRGIVSSRCDNFSQSAWPKSVFLFT